VDAKLSEDVWRQALLLELGYEVYPSENVDAPVRTELLFAYSSTHLYAAFRAFDPDPSAIRARITDRDAMYSDDWVALILDTFNDETRTFDFFCNPLGVQGDQIESPNGGGEWDAIWDCAGTVTDQGYTVEMAIRSAQLSASRTAPHRDVPSRQEQQLLHVPVRETDWLCGSLSGEEHRD
jgi:hypothetical protein